MVETHIQTRGKSSNSAISALALQQQEVAALTLAGAMAASCDAHTTITSIQLLRLEEFLPRLGICRATLYLHISKGTFPKPIAIGPRAVGWLEHEIDAWLAAKI
jgi:prophage regulatory protein